MSMFSPVARSTLLLVGAIVGVGMFGIPFVFVQAGFLTGALELLVLAIAVAIVHLAYAEVVLLTPALHRLPGYVSLYLGRQAAWLSRLSYLFGLSGSLLAYVVLGGFFLEIILAQALPGVPPLLGPAAFYLLGVAVIFFNIRFESLANAILTAGLIIALAALITTLLPTVSVSSLLAFDGARLAVPYGVILFSLAGSAVIPEMRRLFAAGEFHRLRSAVLWGSATPAALYLLFAAAVVGVTGEATTPDAITGLALFFGPAYLFLGSVIGFLATITSFITLGLVLEGMFISDVGIRPSAAWLLTAAIPAALYGFGFQDFIAIISFIGAVAVGLDSIFILLLHRKVTGASARGRGFRPSIPAALRPVLGVVFGLGIAYEFFRLLS